MLIVLFAVWIPIFPLGESVILPSITLSLGLAGVWSRLIRNRVRDSLAFGPATSARARGLPEWRITLKYGLGPVSGLLVAYLGSQFGILLGGAFVTEIIFDWRGLGSLWVSAVLRRDYPVVEAATFVAASTILLESGWAIGCAPESTVGKRDCHEMANDLARALDPLRARRLDLPETRFSITTSRTRSSPDFPALAGFDAFGRNLIPLTLRASLLSIGFSLAVVVARLILALFLGRDDRALTAVSS